MRLHFIISADYSGYYVYTANELATFHIKNKSAVDFVSIRSNFRFLLHYYDKRFIFVR